MSIFWRKFTTQGALWSIYSGLTLSVILIVLSPTVWVEILKNSQAIFPLKNPAIVSFFASFAIGILVSLLTQEKEAEAKFDSEKIRSYIGVGAE
jgi:cation/acetate symporter